MSTPWVLQAKEKKRSVTYADLMKILETLGQTKTILVQSANWQHDESFFFEGFSHNWFAATSVSTILAFSVLKKKACQTKTMTNRYPQYYIIVLFSRLNWN
jgi:hypothetical protein